MGLLAKAGAAGFAILLSGAAVSSASAGGPPAVFPDAASIGNQVLTWAIITSIATVVSTCVGVMVLRARMRGAEGRQHALGEAIDACERRINAVELSCARCPGYFMSKDELARTHLVVADNQQRIMERLDNVDDRNRERVEKVHGRVDEMGKELHTLAGQIEEHLRREEIK